MKFVKFENPMVFERNFVKTSEPIGICKGCTVGRNYFRYRITLLSLNKLRSDSSIPISNTPKYRCCVTNILWPTINPFGCYD